MIKMVKLCLPDVGNDEIEKIKEVINSKWLAHGIYNKEFEEKFAKYIGVKYAVTLNSCTSAIQLALESHNITKEVILPSFTFVASANAIVKAGATPVFADVEYSTGNLDPEKIEELITKNTQAIMPVHYGGQVCDMKRIIEIAEKHNLIVIEDSAETIGGTHYGRQAGSFSTACFSFFPTKNIAVGEGGVLTTNNEEVAKTVKALSAHGISKHTLEREKQDKNWYRDAYIAGYNYRMPHMSAAIGIVQLEKLEKMNEKRRKIAELYKKNLISLNQIDLPVEKDNNKHVYQMYVIKLKDSNSEKRDKLVQKLREKDIEASVHFSPPVHLQTFYKNKFYHKDLSVTEKLADISITLPMYSSMLEEDALKVVSALKQSLKEI